MINIHSRYPFDIQIIYPTNIHRYPQISTHLSIISLYIHDCHGNPSGGLRPSHERRNGSVGCLGTDGKIALALLNPKELQPLWFTMACPGPGPPAGLLMERGLRDRDSESRSRTRRQPNCSSFQVQVQVESIPIMPMNCPGSDPSQPLARWAPGIEHPVVILNLKCRNSHIRG